MTRQDTEEQIMQHLKEIARIYKVYNPKGNYLAMTLHHNCLSVHNEHWDADGACQINAFKELGSNGGVQL